MLKELDSFLIILTAISLAFILALWVSLIIWTLRDIKQRTKDTLFHVLSVLLVLIFNFPGFLIYLILRPKHTFNDYYQQALEEEALLQSIEGFSTCINCGHQIHTDWKFCPYCKQKLHDECTNCGFLLKPEWVACPQCGTPHTQESQHPEVNDASVELELDHEIESSFEDSSSVEIEEENSGEIYLEEEEFDSFQDD